MAHKFQGIEYPTARLMCDAIAEEWMTAAGENTPDEVASIMAKLSPQACAEECIEDWDLLRETESGADWLADQGASAADVLEAFERFFRSRRAA